MKSEDAKIVREQETSAHSLPSPQACLMFELALKYNVYLKFMNRLKVLCIIFKNYFNA